MSPRHRHGSPAGASRRRAHRRHGSPARSVCDDVLVAGTYLLAKRLDDALVAGTNLLASVSTTRSSPARASARVAENSSRISSRSCTICASSAVTRSGNLLEDLNSPFQHVHAFFNGFLRHRLLHERKNGTSTALCLENHCAKDVPLHEVSRRTTTIASSVSYRPVNLISLHSRLQRLSINRASTQVDLRDAARVRDVVERVGVEDDEVGALAAGDRSELIELEDFC